MDEVEAGSYEGQRDRKIITLPHRALVVLCGPAGSGKSTFAQHYIASHQVQGFHTTMIVSSDTCRTLVCDDETNQQVNRDTFDLFHYIIHKRMFQDRFTIADSTALHPEARHRLLEIAKRHSYTTCLLVFQISPETCLQRDKARQRSVGEQVIVYHAELLRQALLSIPHEGWNQVHILNEQGIIEESVEIIVR